MSISNLALKRVSLCFALPFAALFSNPAQAQGAPDADFAALEQSLKSRHASKHAIETQVDIMMAMGASSLEEEEGSGLRGGAHDPALRGFTLQQFELGFSGRLVPFAGSRVTLDLGAYVVLVEDAVELEEASVLVDSLAPDFLPWGLELEAGYFLTEFGLQNPTHPHAWDWMDQAVIVSRTFGGEGMRSAGLRAEMQTEAPWHMAFHFGMQEVASTTPSFGDGFDTHGHGEHEGEEKAGGVAGFPSMERDMRDLSDFIYLLRMEHAATLAPALDLSLGFSSLFGPNATGRDGRTFIGGIDLQLLLWTTGTSRRLLADWTTEFLYRRFRADDFFDEGDPLDAADDLMFKARSVEDYGLYSQANWWLSPIWSLGLRIDWASSSGDNHEHDTGMLIAATDDPLRNERVRISPLLVYQPSPELRLRLQYNYDDAEHLASGSASSIWLGLELSFGRSH